jgi:tRNA U38,U39,U40 pseudouridine synthase TruA
MVRRIVGTSIMIGRGKLATETLKDSLINQTALPYINLAPANGLHLVDVVYPYSFS